MSFSAAAIWMVSLVAGLRPSDAFEVLDQVFGMKKRHPFRKHIIPPQPVRTSGRVIDMRWSLNVNAPHTPPAVR